MIDVMLIVLSVGLEDSESGGFRRAATLASRFRAAVGLSFFGERQSQIARSIIGKYK